MVLWLKVLAVVMSPSSGAAAHFVGFGTSHFLGSPVRRSAEWFSD